MEFRRARVCCLSAQTGSKTEGGAFGGMSIEHFKQVAESACPFMNIMKPRVESIRQGSLTMAVEFTPVLVGHVRNKVLHGGVVATLIDHCSGFCGWTELPQG